MYRVTINSGKYRAVLVGSGFLNRIVSFETKDWRLFSTKLKQAMEYEAAITLHGKNAERESLDGKPEISGIDERRG